MVNRLRERTHVARHEWNVKNVRNPDQNARVSIHHQYYLGEGPATRYYGGLERRADFIMCRGRENRRMECGMVGWSVGWLASWLAGWLVGLAGWQACRLTWVARGSRVWRTLPVRAGSSRVSRISKRPHAGETRRSRARRTHTHARMYIHIHTHTHSTRIYARVHPRRSACSLERFLRA